MHAILEAIQLLCDAILVAAVLCFLAGLVSGVAASVAVADLEERRKRAWNRWINREADRGLELIRRDKRRRYGWRPSHAD